MYTLIGKDLAGYQILGMTGVYRDLDLVGLFRDADIAVEYADTTPILQVEEVWVLTDGVVGYVLPMSAPIKLFKDESVVLARQKEFATHSAEYMGDCGKVM